MIQRQRVHFANAVVLLLLLYLQTTPIEARKPKNALCPIGFQVAYDSGRNAVCYRKKGPETFADKFENCAGNLFSLKLYQTLNLPPSTETLWIDYKNLYDGGPFVDWSYTKDAGDFLETTYEVNRDSMYNVNEELCVVIDPVINFTAVRCNEKHHRYCFTQPYVDPDDMESSDCDPMRNLVPDLNLDEYLSEKNRYRTYRFFSPMPTCLLELIKVRMTWIQSQKACEARGGSLLNRGWRYSNYEIFSDPKNAVTTQRYPLGVRLSTNLTLLRYDAEHDSALIPQSEWMFDEPLSNDTRLGAVVNDSWELVNSSQTFFTVICEKTVQLRQVNLTLFIEDDDIILAVNDTSLPFKKIRCFTDSNGYSPLRASLIKRPNGKPGYSLKTINNGYYWCTHTHTAIFSKTESNRILKIKVKDDTVNTYAVKMTSLARDYDLKNIGSLVQNDWKRKIEEYVFYSTKYRKTYGPTDSYDNHTIWNFRNDRPGLDVKDAKVILKRVFLNSRSVLLHVTLHSSMLPVKPGQWDDINIDFMKPVYFCEMDQHLTSRLALGETKRASVCKIYKCTGDYNEGVQLLITVEDTCYTPVPQILSSTITVTDVTEMTTTETSHTATSQHNHRELDSSDSSEEDVLKAYVESKNTTDTEIPQVTGTTLADTPGTTVQNVSESIPTDGIISTDYSKPPKPTFTPGPVITATMPYLPPTTLPPTTVQPRPPEEKLEVLIEDLNTLLNNSESISVADINDSFDQVDTFLADTEDLEIPGNLLHILDEIGARLYLNGSDDAATVRSNVALLVADSRPTLPLRGLKIAATQADVFTEEAFQFIRDDIEDVHLMSDQNEVVIELPDSVAESNRRISFVAFRNDRAFQTSQLAVNSRAILSIKIENTTEFHNGEVIDIYLSPIKSTPERNETRTCAFWKFLDDGSGGGYWSQDGCTFIRSTTDGMLDTCRCTHLTHFAEVLIPRTVFSERSENALEVISIVGCFTSIIGLILVGVTALLFRSWRRDYSNKVWLQLCISIFIMSLSFLVIMLAHFEEYDVMCTLTGIVLHFSVLSSFCWMLVAAVLSYRRLVTVFTIDASHKLLRASAFAWGVPCAVVGVLLSVAPQSYSGRFDDKNPTAAFCYPSGLALWLSVFAPLALMLVVNWTLFALIVRSVFASRRNHPNRLGNRHSGDKNEALRCASVSFFLVFLFGLPWLLGLFSMNEVMAYFFVFLSTFQGFVLFLFFVLGNKKTRDLWLNKLKIKQTRKIPVTSSSYTNNRSTAGVVNSRSTNQPETIETKISKPRSLTSLDDSRFS